jgi:hypothetical protein
MSTSKKTKKAKKTTHLKWKINPLPGSGQYVNSVSITSDGSKLIAGTYYFDYSHTNHALSGKSPFTVGVFAYQQNKKLLWKDEFPTSEGVYWVAVSRNGAWAAAGGLEVHGQGFIFAYNGGTGTRKLEFKPPARTNMVALDNSGSLLVAGADAIYIFTRVGSAWNAIPQKINSPQPNDTIICVGVSGDGTWIVAGTLKGYVILIKNTAGVLSAPVYWQLVVGPRGGTIHWISIAENGSGFVAGGSGSSAYYFALPGFQLTSAPSWTGALTGCNSCRSVAIADDGTLVSAVANKGNAGKLFVFDAAGNLKWSIPTRHSPNSTSIDATGNLVTVADGFPDETPGSFSLFDVATGTELWNYATNNMSWPMQVAADGKSIAAGSDNCNVYYFL